MILVDSSVWIDYFNGRETEQTDYLDSILGVEPVSVGDLVLTEVLQGFRDERDFKIAEGLMTSLLVFDMLGEQRALSAAGRYRKLRKQGITIRKTSDVIIGSFCIDMGLPLLFSDRDFRPMVQHLGLMEALAGS